MDLVSAKVDGATTPSSGRTSRAWQRRGFEKVRRRAVRVVDGRSSQQSVYQHM